MDGSYISSDKRYVLLDNDIADRIEKLSAGELRRLRPYLELMDCECGCRGQNHIEELAQTLARVYIQETQPATPLDQIRFFSRY